MPWAPGNIFLSWLPTHGPLACVSTWAGSPFAGHGFATPLDDKHRADLGVDLAEVQRFIHGITIGTNAVVKGRGPHVPKVTFTNRFDRR